MIAIIKYNAGNTKSVQNALLKLGVESVVTDDPIVIKNAAKVILPGVGEASSAMQYLKARGLDVVIRDLTQPVLGICLGLQLMCEFTEEGNTDGLRIFTTKVRQFENNMIVPHMGWNGLKILSGNLGNGIAQDSDVYFVHSYYAEVAEETTSTCEYGVEFSATLEKGNFYAAQFHPEKSSTIGNKILENFIAI